MDEPSECFNRLQAGTVNKAHARGKPIIMKKDGLPNSYKKQSLIHDEKMKAEALVSWGERYLEADRVFDAAAFFQKAGHQEGLDHLKRIAQEQGDAFLFKVVVQGAPGKGTRDEWEALGHRAMELEKFSHAVNAFLAAGNEDARKRAEDELSSLGSRPAESAANP